MFQQCLDTFKLNKHAKCLNLTINNSPMCIESNSSLLMCIIAYKLIALSFAFSPIVSFPLLLKCETDMVVSYCIVPYLLWCYAWVVTNNASRTQLLKMLHKCYNMEMLGVLLIYSHATHPQESCIYIS